MLLVVKRSGNVEQFDRNKVISGVRKACQGRPINEDDLKMLGQKVEEDLRSRGLAQVKSDEDRKSTRLNSSHMPKSRMPSSA